jgi:catechol 2,3-dioxygenase-like lactoylglutathione lyase family enzyme
MKRFHVNVAVADLERSTRFYTTLFGADPDVRKTDYVKWMLEDPRINFSINTSERNSGINHVGLQADSTEELDEIRSRLHEAGQATFDQPEAECCYASSSKSWVRDPDDVAWEAFVTHGEITHYGNDIVTDASDLPLDASGKCCETESSTRCCA